MTQLLKFLLFLPVAVWLNLMAVIFWDKKYYEIGDDIFYCIIDSKK